jgi:hypothetical protein
MMMMMMMMMMIKMMSPPAHPLASDIIGLEGKGRAQGIEHVRHGQRPREQEHVGAGVFEWRHRR